ncbi:MAG TPA: GNAT family N-acetyltransferase [Sphingomonadaceae bacterium]|nr:GNAT family N-acetyltransferase [Sphingomonadaceae bacterium]
MRIRPAAAQDCAALEALIEQLGYEAQAGDIAARLAEIRADGREVLVAEEGGRVVGCLSTSIMRVLHRPKPVGRISMMVVADGLRGQGIGAALVRAAEEWLVAQGCGMVEVTSNNRRADAHRFYEKLGYEKTSVRLAREP